MRTDVYARITGQIVAELEKAMRPWLKPWNAEHAAGRIAENPLPYQSNWPKLGATDGGVAC